MLQPPSWWAFSQEAAPVSRLWAGAYAVPLPEMLILAVSGETPMTQISISGDEV